MIKVAFRITGSFTLKGYAFLDRLNCKKETFIIMAMNVKQSVIKVMELQEIFFLPHDLPQSYFV